MCPAALPCAREAWTSSPPSVRTEAADRQTPSSRRCRTVANQRGRAHNQPMETAFWHDKRRTADVLGVLLLIAVAVVGLSLLYRTPVVCAAVMLAALGFALSRWH